MFRRATLIFLLIFATGACGGAGLAAAPSGPPDAPLAAGEPRESVWVRIDLRQSAGCEQEYDLALYESRALVLIEWAETTTRCRARRARVHYLPKRISKSAVLELLSKPAAARVTPIEEPRS